MVVGPLFRYISLINFVAGSKMVFILRVFVMVTAFDSVFQKLQRFGNIMAGRVSLPKKRSRYFPSFYTTSFKEN